MLVRTIVSAQPTCCETADRTRRADCFDFNTALLLPSCTCLPFAKVYSATLKYILCRRSRDPCSKSCSMDNATRMQAQSPMTPIQYKINARKAMTGKNYVGAKELYPTNSVIPENAAAGQQPDAVATVSFGASAYTGTEHNGHIRLQVTCARCGPSFCLFLSMAGRELCSGV